MSVLASLYSGISGIVSNGSALSVSGDNIANMNTTAFKSSNALFESNLTQRIGDVQVGLGSRLAATNTAFSQGAFANSSRNTDLAIEGDGFFAVQNNAGERFYTRAGSFSFDNAGRVVSTVGGFQLMGQSIDSVTGNASGSVGPININNASSDPVMSTLITMNLNLDPEATVIDDPFEGDSFANAEASSNFSVPSTMFDSRGTPREVITYFRRADDDSWEAYTLTAAKNLDLPGGSADGDNDTVVLKSWKIDFGLDGKFAAMNEDSLDLVDWNDTTTGTGSPTPGAVLAGERLNGHPTMNIPWDGAEILDWDTFDLDLDPENGAGNATNFTLGSGSEAKSVSTDGRSVGELQSIDITAAGMIRGIFSNGDSRDLFKIPLAIFANNEGLARLGANLYQETASSGGALLGDPGANGRGEVRSFSLEQSNVDLATEFVKIIQYQRGFQASARTISAAADILQELVNLGR